MTKHIEIFQGQIAIYFRELILATAYLDIGHRNLVGVNSNASVALTLAPDITTEPMYLKELLPHSASVTNGISELFQTKTIAAWHDLLNNLFAYFVKSHFSGGKLFPELKKRKTRVDFTSTKDITSQVTEELIADFAFEKYAERIKIINNLLNASGNLEDELSIIKKHVLIRNSIQHHNGKVYEDMLKDLGCKTIAILNHEGNPLTLQSGEAVRLFIPELDQLKGALFRLTNNWRKSLA